MAAVLKGDKLYGRGGADDGYAIFACAVRAAGARASRSCRARRCVDHDRGLRGIGQLRPARLHRSPAGRIGKPSLVVCLDSGCGNYDQLWITTSLRGIAAGTLTVAC